MFARAYTRLLAGHGSAEQLPYATITSRGQAVRAGAIPHVSGPVRLESQRTLGRTCCSLESTATVRAARRAYSFSFTVLLRPAGWRTAVLTAPDFSTARAPGLGQRIAVPANARAAALRFGVAYVDYALGASTRPPVAGRTALNEIQSGADPLAGRPVTHRRARLGWARFGPSGHAQLAVSVRVKEAREAVTFSFLLRRRAHRWEADEFL